MGLWQAQLCASGKVTEYADLGSKEQQLGRKRSWTKEGSEHNRLLHLRV